MQRNSLRTQQVVRQGRQAKKMDWIGLICNLVALVAGLFLYIGITNSKFGKKYENLQYGIMLVCVIAACVIGGVLKWFF